MVDDIRVLVADHLPVFRQGLRAVIAAEPGLCVSAEAQDGGAALAAIRRDPPDVAMLDLQLPGLGALQVAENIVRDGLRTRILFVSLNAEPAMFERAMAVGATGYVLKDASLSEILQAIGTVAAGRTFVSPALSDYLVRRAFPGREASARTGSPLAGLTERERMILRLIADSRTSKDIADVLGLHYRTVENHRTALSQKLGLQGSHSLVKFAFSNKVDL